MSNTNDNTNYGSTDFDFDKLTTGDIDLQSYLFDSGLQNVFNDYQQNIATLKKEEQQSLQDAYYIREMSKKYLGEYASNNNISNVSGGLLDIYSNYQNNISDINKNYDTLKLGLTQQYQSDKLNLTQAYQDHQSQVALSNIRTNLATNNFGEYSNAFEYLDSVKGQIGEIEYNNLKTEIYQNTLNNLTMEDIVKQENPEEYINQLGLSENDTTSIMDTYNEYKNVMNILEIEQIDNSTLQDYDFDMLLHGENIDKDSTYAFKDSVGTKYFSVKEHSSHVDEKYTKDASDLLKEFQKLYGRNPADGERIKSEAYDKERKTDVLTWYVYLDGTWHRMAREQAIEESDMKFWTRENKEDYSNNRTDDFQFNNNYKKGAGFLYKNRDTADTFTYKGITYKQDENEWKGSKAGVTKAVQKLFNDVHGQDDGSKASIVFWNNNFYLRMNNKIYKMNKQE